MSATKAGIVFGIIGGVVVTLPLWVFAVQMLFGVR